MNNEIETMADEGVDVFTGNSKWWKKCYDEASDIVKQYYKYIWGANHRKHDVLSDLEGEDEFVEEMFKIGGEAMGKFTQDDWNYLIERTNNPMQKLGLVKLRDAKFPAK